MKRPQLTATMTAIALATMTVGCGRFKANELRPVVASAGTQGPANGGRPLAASPGVASRAGASVPLAHEAEECPPEGVYKAKGEPTKSAGFKTEFPPEFAILKSEQGVAIGFHASGATLIDGKAHATAGDRKVVLLCSRGNVHFDVTKNDKPVVSGVIEFTPEQIAMKLAQRDAQGNPEGVQVYVSATPSTAAPPEPIPSSRPAPDALAAPPAAARPAPSAEPNGDGSEHTPAPLRPEEMLPHGDGPAF